MSFPRLPPPPRPGSEAWDAVRAVDAQEGFEKAVEQRTALDSEDGFSEPSRRRGIVDRIRSVFQGGDLSARQPEVDVGSEDAWERERKHRWEDEQGQSN